MNRRYPHGREYFSFRPALVRLEDRFLPSLLPPVDYNFGEYPGMAAAGDFNGDGQPDLAVTTDNNPAVTVFLNQGGGFFQRVEDSPAGPSPTASAAAGDFDGDGRPDLAVAYAGSGRVGVLLGSGDGSFRPPVLYATGEGPVTVAVGDFNGDGIADLVTANAGAGTMGVLLGRGDGTFEAAMDSAAGPGPAVLAVGDLNGDGLADVAVTNYGAATVTVLMSNGDGTFLSPVAYPVGPGPSSVALGDFDGNGAPDVVTANYADGFGHTVTLYLGNGDGTFQAARTDEVDLGVDSVAPGDFNGDGQLDLLTAHCYYDGVTEVKEVSVHLGGGDGTFQPGLSYELDAHPNMALATDLNGDGYPDAVTTNFDHVAVLLNAADWAPAPANARAGWERGSPPPAGTGGDGRAAEAGARLPSAGVNPGWADGTASGSPRASTAGYRALPTRGGALFEVVSQDDPFEAGVGQ